jgi:DNA-binding NarL/FixJ family response regulator
MNILVNLSSRLFSEALYLILKKEEVYHLLVADDTKTVNNFNPNIILVDFNSINKELFSQYPESKFVLIDTGIKQEDIIATLLSYRISGVLSANINLNLFKKALKVIFDGQVWVDNNTLKAFLHNAGLLSKTGKINGITEKEKEIIESVCKGYKNKQIASKLCLSEHTVKAHLNRIYRKFNISTRSQLVAIAMNNNEVGKSKGD